MSDMRTQQSESRLDLLWELIGENVTIAGDITEIATDTWAIHGVIPSMAT